MRIVITFLMLALSPVFLAAAVTPAPPAVTDKAVVTSAELSREAMETKLGRKLKFKERISLAIVRGKVKRAERRQAKAADGRVIDGFALASTFSALFMVLAPILVFAAIILGIVGLSRISRRPAERKGRGFAVFGIVMGLLGLIFFIIALSALESVLGELFSGIGG